MYSIIESDTEKIIQRIDFTKLKNKSILITGASGLIGIHIVSCLKKIQKEYNINIFCWIKSELDINSKEFFKNCTIITGNIADVSVINKLNEFDFIIHAAGYAQPSKFLEHKITTIELNTISTIKLIDKLKKNGTFLFLSTSELYSGLMDGGIDENMIGNTNTNHPRACYIESKRTGESICYAYKELGYNIKIARVSSAYGPGTKLNDKRVLNTLIEKGIVEDKITLLDNGSARRIFCYITDTVEMLFNIMLNSNDILYNVSGIHEFSILELANRIGNLLNKPVYVCNNNYGGVIGNPNAMNISNIKYMNEFCTNPLQFTDFDYGLLKTIEWQKALIGFNK
jgi:UDP-glucuronate decarboxylase